MKRATVNKKVAMENAHFAQLLGIYITVSRTWKTAALASSSSIYEAN
jgi:hypothetical protein